MDKVKEKPYIVDETATVPLAYHEMCTTRHHKSTMTLIICWAASIVLTVLAFVVLWLQYDYVSYTDNTGVYVVTDSQGNVIAADLEPDDVIRIMQELNDGEDSENKKP